MDVGLLKERDSGKWK